MPRQNEPEKSVSVEELASKLGISPDDLRRKLDWKRIDDVPPLPDEEDE